MTQARPEPTQAERRRWRWLKRCMGCGGKRMLGSQLCPTCESFKCAVYHLYFAHDAPDCPTQRMAAFDKAGKHTKRSSREIKELAGWAARIDARGWHSIASDCMWGEARAVLLAATDGTPRRLYDAEFDDFKRHWRIAQQRNARRRKR